MKIRPFLAPLYFATWKRVYVAGRIEEGHIIDVVNAAPLRYAADPAGLFTVIGPTVFVQWLPRPERSFHVRVLSFHESAV